jgi:hypothetical protein
MSATEDAAAPQVEVVDPAAAPGSDELQQETVMDPAKLLRIASMVRQLLDDTRQATLDEAGRTRLADIYQRSVTELGESISQDLKEELAELAPPLGGVPSESEIRIAQAQLVGWLEGLFHGIQATLFAQQLAARQQLEQMRQLPGGPVPPGFVPGPRPVGGPDERTGTYL